MFVDTLIIGNGFAGRSVASELHGEVLIVERGEKFNIFERRQRFYEIQKEGKIDRHSAMIRHSYVSALPFNKPEKIGGDCRSEYILVDGGCSNHWGGLSFRLTENIFSDRKGTFAWPFTMAQVKPFYSKAEQLLRIAADPNDPDERNPQAQIKGGAKWRAALEPFFPAAYIGAQSHNLTGDNSNGQGSCMGAGDCELCPLDAKTRSLHIRAGTRVLNGVLVESLRFENGKAVEALCTTQDGPLSISFNRVIVAAHGVESMKLLLKSNLPKATPAHLMGHHYQDHAIAQLTCKLPGSALPYHELNTSAQLVIPELSGERDGIEYTTLGLMTPISDQALSGALDLNKINHWELEEAIREVGSTLALFILLEIPPEWDVAISYKNGKISLESEVYHREKKIYDRIVQDIYDKIESAGAVPLKSGEMKHYNKWFGTHHLVGTLGMGNGPRSVVDSEFKLRGTDNVYVTGSAVFPRCGSRNPTVTVVALSLMLADQLNGRA
ncbi:GMC family oxidoreductase [Pseudomonas sp. PDM23]|uniref:GMC oxidoreductase n=1 Tax=unclassified Pseudomonas TaxID=196821 RepID=UPI00178387B4|nr:MULTISPECIES: GMC oxidoreductase [unclassified Pseudomonas]MBD9576212.1 GMC family oxidoreductase [Pseudomonas sp. PDM23]MBD9670139.1 GMC family oxidoreductase [Pseudomonas sp. PDM21]